MKKTELDVRREKLSVFLKSDKTSNIDSAQLSLLHAQSHIMDAYSNILSARLVLIPAPDSKE